MGGLSVVVNKRSHFKFSKYIAKINKNIKNYLEISTISHQGKGIRDFRFLRFIALVMGINVSSSGVVRKWIFERENFLKFTG